jgi:tetratricopeptide (TPR) repeat protein
MLCVGAALMALVLGSPTTPAQVLQPEIREAFLADPLTDVLRDPLLPSPPIPRSLSPLEEVALTQALDQLLVTITELGLAGDTQIARALWMREIRLRRLLGVRAELVAMARAAPTLRDWNATQELQLLSARLTTLVAETHLPLNQLQEVAVTYTALGNLEAALSLRRTLAETARDQAAYSAQLEQIANLYEAGFQFPEAAKVYQELVAIATDQGVTSDQVRFLQAQIKNQAQDPAGALEAQQRLLQLYLRDSTSWPQVPGLQYAMANNQVLLGDLDTASRQYQIAYTNAIGNQQFSLAAATLEHLVRLYEGLGRWTDVDYLYDQLLRVHQTTSNAYGLMDSFDQLGQLYEKRRNPEAALLAYRQGLTLARRLDHRQTYFETQIKRLTETEVPYP